MWSTASTKVLKFRERHLARCRLRVNSESTTRLHDFFKISVSGADTGFQPGGGARIFQEQNFLEIRNKTK